MTKKNPDSEDPLCAKYEFEYDGLNLLWTHISIGSSKQPILNSLNNSDDSTAILDLLNYRNSTFDIISIYIENFKINGTDYNFINYSPLFLLNRQVAIMDYLPTIKKYKYALGLASSKENSYLDLDTRVNILPLSSSPNTLKFGIRARSPEILYQEETYHDLFSIMSNVGGLFTTLSGIFVFLFGASKIAPWGFMQKYVFGCITCRRSFISSLAKKYISTAGIPFGEKVSKMPINATLEDRVQIIETLLKEYYIDTDFLELLKKEKLMYRKISQEKSLIHKEVADDDDDIRKDNYKDEEYDKDNLNENNI